MEIIIESQLIEHKDSIKYLGFFAYEMEISYRAHNKNDFLEDVLISFLK